ncbi:MAG TPA: D-amino acid aminotransferase [Steroidobacteraceae bacterium]|jgi:D-alanine transaminase|nr:D-amino acid aminotransferase [Steroidobacteraceae bacterium]
MADPLPLCYLDGDYLPLREARISPLDRGFLYADGVYEVMPVYGGRPFRFTAHAERLTRSLTALRMANPHSHDEWHAILGTLVERNGGGDQYIYWQVTRGAQYGRTHAPLPDIPRTVFAFCAPLPVATPQQLETGIACITAIDTRWARCDVKSVALLANVLLRQESIDAGAAETILLREGELTEASASAVHIVIGRELLTPPNSRRILPGTTRGVVEEMAGRAAIPWRSAPVSEAQLRAADEVLISAATREVQPVTSLDGRPVGSGKPGPHWRAIHEQLQRYKHELAGTPW